MVLKIIADPFLEVPTHKVYKLRLVYYENAEIKINIEESNVIVTNYE